MIEEIKKAAALIEEVNGVLRRGPVSFYLDELAGAYDLLMSRYAPFKTGDRVRLAVTPEISADVAWGWLGSKHFLVKGRPGVIKEARCGSKGFRFDVMFDEETWLDRDGKEQPIPEQDKHVYCFRDTDLERASGVLTQGEKP